MIKEVASMEFKSFDKLKVPMKPPMKGGAGKGAPRQFDSAGRRGGK